MTVSSTDLEDYTPFRVDDTDAAAGDPLAITATQFSKFSALAKIKLDRDNPGLITAEYDHAHALLIAHHLAAKQGSLEKTSEKSQDYSYSKEAGKTSFLIQYEALIQGADQAVAGQPTNLIAHRDEGMEDLKLDQATVPGLFDPDDVSGEAAEDLAADQEYEEA